MNSVKFGQKFICFSLVIEDGKAYGSNSFFQSYIKTGIANLFI